MFDVRKIANAILDIAEARDCAITNMALNKIAYFSHGWYLALYGGALVDSNFEAWQFGPVHPQVYRQFKEHEDRPIRTRATKIDLISGDFVKVEYDLDADVIQHLSKMVDFYGRFSAGKLSSISHEVGAPWDQVWNSPGSSPGMTISDEVTRSYYVSKLKRPS